MLPMNVWRRRALLAGVASVSLLLASCGSDTADTPPLFSTMVVLGSSLSDTGNQCPTASVPGCPPVPPYAAGRISNGPLYIESVAALYGASVTPSTRGGTNFAYAGARTGAIPGLATQSSIPSMVQQLDQYVQRPAAPNVFPDRVLFVIEAGGAYFNNFQAGLPLIQAGTITSQQFVGAAITDVITVMTRLYAAGARHMLLITAPNFGLTPALLALGGQGANAGTQLSAAFNQALAQQVQILVNASPGLTVYTFDTFSLLSQIVSSPGSFGLSNVTDACVATPTCVGSATAPDGYLFWDSVHPTRAAGAVFAGRIAALLPPPQ